MTIVLTLAVVLLALVCFVGEWFPADVTAIAVMVLLMTLGLVTPEEGISGFSNAATVTVLAMFILSAGIERTGAVQTISHGFVAWGGRRARRQILVMGAIVGPISAFINNTAVVAIFLPVVEDWCRKQGISPSKLLLPLSYLAILGGMLTVIGTSTNVLASGIAADLGYEAFGLFEFTGVGLVTGAIGLLYLAFVAPRWLPQRRSQSDTPVLERYGLGTYISEIVIPPGSNLVGQSLQSSQLQRKFDLDVMELIRDGATFSQPLADKPLQAGDILLVRSQPDCLLKIKAIQGIKNFAGGGVWGLRRRTSPDPGGRGHCRGAALAQCRDHRLDLERNAVSSALQRYRPCDSAGASAGARSPRSRSPAIWGCAAGARPQTKFIGPSDPPRVCADSAARYGNLSAQQSQHRDRHHGRRGALSRDRMAAHSRQRLDRGRLDAADGLSQTR
jgi:hypothetical protein